MESVAPRGRKTGPADKNHSRCVTYRFECDGRRSLPILFTLHPLFPPSAYPRLSTLSVVSISQLFSFLSRAESLSRAQYTKLPHLIPCKLPPLSILAVFNSCHAVLSPFSTISGMLLMLLCHEYLKFAVSSEVFAVFNLVLGFVILSSVRLNATQYVITSFIEGRLRRWFLFLPKT